MVCATKDDAAATEAPRMPPANPARALKSRLSSCHSFFLFFMKRLPAVRRKNDYYPAVYLYMMSFIDDDACPAPCCQRLTRWGEVYAQATM